jgi:hypothetical protein
MGRKPRSGTAVRIDQTATKRSLSIYKVLGVEEEIWSPTYGIKGNNVLMQIRYQKYRNY